MTDRGETNKRDGYHGGDGNGWLAGLMAVLVAPALVACCGGGGVLLAGLAGLLGAAGGWISGLSGIGMLAAAIVAALIWRARAQKNACDRPALESER